MLGGINKTSGGRSDGLNYFPGFQAFGADVFFSLLAFHQDRDLLQIRQPAAFSMPVRMGNAHADHRFLFTNKTFSAHNIQSIT